MIHDERSMVARLCRKHREDVWLQFTQFPSKPGYGPARLLDFVAVHKSLNHAVGYEIKLTRADFMREIEDPSKREPFVEMFNEFWFFTPPGLVRPDEVPEGCGLIEVSGARTRKRKVAKQKPKANLSRDVCAVIVSKLMKQGERDRQKIERFARFQGKVLSFDDVIRISEKASKLPSVRERMRRQIEAEARASNQQHYRMESRHWMPLVQDLRRVAGHHLTGVPHRLAGFDDCKQFVELLKLTSLHHGLDGLAAKLREVADQVDSLSPFASSVDGSTDDSPGEEE